MLRTGCPWEALNATGLRPHSTAHDRLQPWVAARVWQKLWKGLGQDDDELVGLDWSYLSVDGSLTKAPLAIVGEKSGPNRRTGASWGQTQRGDGRGERASRRQGGRCES